MAEPKSEKTDKPAAAKAPPTPVEQGFVGAVPDPTPNERYSLQSDDWRTPETDPAAAAAAGSTRFAGKGGDK